MNSNILWDGGGGKKNKRRISSKSGLKDLYSCLVVSIVG